jgi:CubicO group peptidase (beta-lactamase class C family)
MRKDLGIPGLSLVIVKDDQIIYLKGFGRRDIQRDLPVTPDTLFAIGSTTKAFTSMMAMISVDQGKLSLDDSPKRFLPYFKLSDSTADAQVTLRDLLCHRTGLMAYSDLAVATGKLNRQELIQVMGRAKPTARFREKFQYNNIMYAAAGEAVAKANQTTWEQLIEQLIFKPLGMKATNTSIVEMQRSTDFSRGYAPVDGDGKNLVLPFIDLSSIAPTGGINSNANDLAQWLRLMLNHGVFNGKRLVSTNSFAQLWSPQMHVREHVDYGLGWGLADWNGLRLVLHNGGLDGFHTLIEMVPDKKIGFAVLANVETPALDAAARRIVWSNLLDIKPASSSSAAGSATDTNLNELVATYKDATGGTTAQLKLKDGKPVLTLPGDPPYNLIAKGVDEFSAKELPATYSLRVRRDSAGKVTGIALVEPEGTTELTRYDGRTKPFVSPMSTKTLMQRMVVAAGGKANLQKHRTMSASIAMDFENQGVTASAVVSARAPNSHTLQITLTALDKTIGTVREYFDGSHGGEQLSFGSAEKWEAAEIENKKIETDFYNQLLDWSTLFKSVTITKMSRIGTERVFVVDKIGANGALVRDYVSARSFLLLRRESGAGSDRITETFSDFRIVDGVRVPFQTLQQSEEYGDVRLRVQQLRFNVDLAPAVFQAH